MIDKHGFLGVFGAVFVISAVGAFAATPETADRPGRPTPQQTTGSAQSLPATATTQRAESANEAPPESDADLLKKTAAEMDVPEQFDQRLLNYFGLRPRLESAGYSFEGNLTIDYSKNFIGGVDTASDAFRHLLDLRFSIDTHAAFGLDGGTFSIDFQNQNGRNGSDQLTGDEQGFDNADADGRTQISELWYQQMFFDDRLRIKIGKVDANSEFAFPEYGADFVNSSFGHSPTIFAMPTYPDPAMSANIFVNPVPWYYASAGIYDGSGARGVATGDYGPKHFFDGSPGDYFGIAENGVRWVFADDTLPGRFAVGGWYSNADFTRFNGDTQSGTGGVYAMLEQTIWHKKYYDKTSLQGVAAFLQYGHDNDHVNDISDHLGAGITWTGPIDSADRQDDVMGLGATYVKFSNDAAAGFTDDYEMSIEAFYGIQLKEYLVIKPDLQYIIHPGGTGADDALVATIRVTFAF